MAIIISPVVFSSNRISCAPQWHSAITTVIIFLKTTCRANPFFPRASSTGSNSARFHYILVYISQTPHNLGSRSFLRSSKCSPQSANYPHNYELRHYLLFCLNPSKSSKTFKHPHKPSPHIGDHQASTLFGAEGNHLDLHHIAHPMPTLEQVDPVQ